MQGVQAKANAAPATSGPPLPARCMSASTCHSLFSRVTKKEATKRTPIAMIKAAAILSSASRWSLSSDPILVAPMPSRMNTAEKLPQKIRLGTRTFFQSAPSSSSAVRPETADRYPGTIGSTQGERKETIPATSAVSKPTPAAGSVAATGIATSAEWMKVSASKGLRAYLGGMDQLLEQAVVAITGGARGIGRASAEQLAAAGGRVAIGDLDGEAAAKAASDIGKRAIGIQVDVTDHDSFEAFLEQAEAELGPLDGLVNNAGVMLLGPIDEEDPEQTGTMIAVNLTGVINGTRLAISKMKPRHRGRIINIASQAGKAGLSGGATYCATKFGVIGFSESVRQELKGSGVGISWILPGVVDTAMTAGLPDTRLMEMLSPDEVASAVVKAMKEGGSEVWVPARNQWLDAPLRLLPRHLRERVFAMTGADQVLAGADPERRRGYEGPISGDS